MSSNAEEMTAILQRLGEERKQRNKQAVVQELVKPQKTKNESVSAKQGNSNKVISKNSAPTQGPSVGEVPVGNRNRRKEC